MSAIDLRLGDWRTALADVDVVDAVITDPPYGDATHSANIYAAREGRGLCDGKRPRRSIDYAAWSGPDVREFVGSWAPRCRGWFVALASHDLVPEYTAALEASGRYVFAPLPYVAPGSRIRLCGDGPSSWTCWVVVARPRHEPFSKWGTLPGAYVLPAGFSEDKIVVGGKESWLMRALARDYTRPGDLVCDPRAGGATTLIAAASENRRAVGAEIDPATHAKAMARIARGYTPSLFGTA